MYRFRPTQSRSRRPDTRLLYPLQRSAHSLPTFCGHCLCNCAPAVYLPPMSSCRPMPNAQVPPIAGYLQLFRACSSLLYLIKSHCILSHHILSRITIIRVDVPCMKLLYLPTPVRAVLCAPQSMVCIMIVNFFQAVSAVRCACCALYIVCRPFPSSATYSECPRRPSQPT